MFYSIIGIALLLLSAVTIACMVVFEVRDRKVGKPLPGKRQSQKTVFPGVSGCRSQSL
mgnify:CR=1 FL=1